MLLKLSQYCITIILAATLLFTSGCASPRSPQAISVEISELQRRTASTSLYNRDDLAAILTTAGDSVRAAAEEAQSGEPALAIDRLRTGKAKLQEYGQALQPQDESQRGLAPTAKRLESKIEDLLASYDASVRQLIGDLLLWNENSHSIGTPVDRTAFGPPIIEEPDNHLQVYLKIREGSMSDAEIDDIVDTCGIWICPNDDCLCTEWECSGDGPSGSFP